MICISHILELRKVSLCLYIICIYEESTIPLPLLTPVANSGDPETTLAFHNSLEGFTEFTIFILFYFFTVKGYRLKLANGRV